MNHFKALKGKHVADPEFALNAVNAVSANRSLKHTMLELSKLPYN